MKYSLFTRLLSLFLVFALMVPCFPLVTAEEIAAEITEMTEGKQVTDVVLTVENGKIASISYSYKKTQSGVEMTMSITLTFTDYGTTVAEDPNA